MDRKTLATVIIVVLVIALAIGSFVLAFRDGKGKHGDAANMIPPTSDAGAPGGAAFGGQGMPVKPK